MRREVGRSGVRDASNLGDGNWRCALIGRMWNGQHDFEGFVLFCVQAGWEHPVMRGRRGSIARWRNVGRRDVSMP